MVTYGKVTSSQPGRDGSAGDELANAVKQARPAAHVRTSLRRVRNPRLQSDEWQSLNSLPVHYAGGRARAEEGDVKVTWVFDIISPFVYLNLKQFPQLPANVEVEYMPVLFAAVLNHVGQLGPAEIPAKRRFTFRFALWRAAQMGVPMRFPPAHPFNPIAALRLVIAAGSDRRAVEAVSDAVFMHGRDVADPAVIEDLARQLGVADPESALAAQSVKDRLRANTDWAIARGVFGVPTFVVGEELFWGHDAFGMVLDYLRDPALFQTPEMLQIERMPAAASRKRKS
jgi:2-hydroxychromene-2-carboxylate isomerase